MTNRLQSGSPRITSRLTGSDAEIVGSLEVGVKAGTQTTTAYFKLPVLTTAQRVALTAEEGMHVYDSNLGKDMTYRGAGWGASDGTAAGSLDAAYNGGAEIAVDAGAVTLTDTQTTTGGGLLITKSGKVTSTHGASVFHINSTGAHDTSGDLKMLEISVGTETILGSVYGVEIEMNANSDSGLEITKGAAVLSDGALTLTSGALTMTSGNFTMSSGNADITGTLTVSDVAALEEITASGAYTGEGRMILDVDNAEALLIRENSDAADVLTVDTTQDAGDTTMLLTTKVTTGSGFHLDGSTITTGDALKITVAAVTMTAAGAAISVVADGTEVFAVRDDGTVLSKATAEGTTAIGVTTGDIVLSDGDLTLSGGELSVTDGVTTSGSGVAIISSMTTAGAAAGAAGALTITAASATTGTVLAITADALTSGDMLYLDNGGGTLNGGFYINCNDDNASDFTVGNYGATVITGTAAGTAALTLTTGDVVVTDSDASTISSVNGTGTLLTLDNAGGVIASDTAVLSIDAGGAVASGGNLLRVAATGTPNAGAIGVEFVGAGKALTALYIDADPTGSDVATINGGGALTNDNAVLTVTSDGALATGGNTFRVETAGTPASGAVYAEFDFAGLTDANENVGVLIDATSKKVQALKIDAAPLAGSTALVTSTGAIAADKATLEVVSNVTACDADSAVVRIEQSHTTGVSPCLALKQDDVSQAFMNFEGTATADAASSISTHGTAGATTDFIRIELNGTDAWIAVSTNDPSA